MVNKLKIVIIGDSRVGKTSLRKGYMGEGFRGSYTATLGAEFSVKHIGDQTITIFDLGGDATNKLLRRQYYSATDGIILVYDVLNRQSFENLNAWFEELKINLDRHLPIFILGNKNDLIEDVNSESTAVMEDEAYEYVLTKQDNWNESISHLATSAKTGYNVEVAFNKLVAEIMYKQESV